METIKVRYANNEDIPFIKKCLINSWVEHAKKVPNLLDEEHMKKSDVENYYKTAIENENSIFGWDWLDVKVLTNSHAPNHTSP